MGQIWLTGFVNKGFFFFFFFNALKILLIFDCAGSLLLHGLSPSCGEWGLLSSGRPADFRCSDFSCFGAQALGHAGFSHCGIWAQ